jgi:hypothetical protein
MRNTNNCVQVRDLLVAGCYKLEIYLIPARPVLCWFWQDLGRRDPEAVIRAYESGQIPQTEATLAEYVKVSTNSPISLAYFFTAKSRSAG